MNLGSSRIGQINHPYFEDYNADENIELQFYIDSNNLVSLIDWLIDWLIV